MILEIPRYCCPVEIFYFVFFLSKIFVMYIAALVETAVLDTHFTQVVSQSCSYIEKKIQAALCITHADDQMVEICEALDKWH